MDFSFKAKPPSPYLCALGLFLLFVGVRIHLIMAHASQTPYWDDWAMGTRMAMYMESGFDQKWLYSLANEHRATFSKLTNLFLFKLNNHQWDPYITMVLDAFLWGFIGVLMLYIGFREKSKINSWLYASLIVVLWTYPLSLFNTLSTIQTYLYYMIIFSVCGFWLITHKAFSIKWFCGLLLVAAACMTAGGGSFAPVAVTAVSLFLAFFGKERRTQHLLTAACAGVFAIFGLYLVLSQGSAGVSGSKSWIDFLISLFKTLSWPASDKIWPSIFFLLPITLLALGVSTKKIAQSRITSFTLMMAAFGIMLSIAIAYARGFNGSGPAERYFDFLTIYLVASALSLMLIQETRSEKQSRFYNGLAVIWLLMCIVATPYHFAVAHFQLNDRSKLVPIQEDIMARYSVSYNPEIFKNRSFREVPFPFSNVLQNMMEQLKQADALPYCLQYAQMDLTVKDNSFTKNGIVKPNENRYRGLENVLGSFNLNAGAQNATGEYTSEVFTAVRPYVMVPVNGHLGLPGTSLALVGENNGKRVLLQPKPHPASKLNQWREILLKAPDSKFRIVVRDDSHKLWFAFAAPRSVGQLSFFVDRIISHGDKIWVFGLFLLAIAGRRQIIQLVAMKEDGAVGV